MLNRSRSLATAVLLTSALVTLTACNGAGSDGNTGASSGSQNSSSGSQNSSSAHHQSDSGAKSSAGQGGSSGSGGNGGSGESGSGGSAEQPASNSGGGGKVSLPEPGGNMTVAAVGDDALAGFKTVFYSITDGSGPDALGDYEQKLNSAGFLAEMPDENTLEASKGGVELKLTATSSFSVHDLVTLQVQKGSVALPSSPQEADITNAVPELSGDNNLIAAGEDASTGAQVAFYDADSDFMSALQDGGCKMTPVQQDGEAVKDFNTCTKSDGTQFNVEVTKNALVGGLGIVTPTDS